MKARRRGVKRRTALPRGFRALVDRLFALTPETRAADQARWALEHLLLKLVTRRGLGAVARAVAAAGGDRFAPFAERASARAWLAPHPSRKHEVLISVSDDGILQTASVSYPVDQAARLRDLTPAQRARHERQEAFYARYMAAGRAAYGRRGGYRRLGRDDRLILRVGELEADVNNGGFSQYLSNKGRPRARLTLAALRAIGARRTARLLEQALSARSEDVLGKLDDRFCRGPEDLALLALRYVDDRRPPQR